jgi:hypothetical protein
MAIVAGARVGWQIFEQSDMSMFLDLSHSAGWHPARFAGSRLTAISLRGNLKVPRACKSNP